MSCFMSQTFTLDAYHTPEENVSKVMNSRATEIHNKRTKRTRMNVWEYEYLKNKFFFKTTRT